MKGRIEPMSGGVYKATIVVEGKYIGVHFASTRKEAHKVAMRKAYLLRKINSTIY